MKFSNKFYLVSLFSVIAVILFWDVLRPFPSLFIITTPMIIMSRRRKSGEMPTIFGLQSCV